MKPILVSGIQPTGKLHLGNYLGALRQFVELQNSGEYECFFFIADYHSLTESFDPKEKRGQILDLAASYLAAGLDPKLSTIFLQSDVPASTELAWIFNTIAPLGELERMTQFKDKSERQESINVGLLTYPLLMAADILLYDAHVVPVGDDQRQHLELTRTIARKFNSKFGETFREPKELLTQTPRLMSLDDPTKKMSKSLPNGCVFIDDDPETISAKFKRAVTDSGNDITYHPEEKAGIANLIRIMADLTGKTYTEIATECKGKQYSEFKQAVADVVINYFAQFRKQKTALVKKTATLEKALAAGAKKAHKISLTKIATVKKQIGIQ